MINGVIYARYSSHNQTEQSIEGQVRVCQAYAEAHGIRVLKVYADRAIPGKTDRRPEFQQMVEDSASHTFQAVILYNTDRFARNRYLAAVYKHQLRQNGVELKYATGAIPDGPEGIILEGLMESMAEYYSAELSVKVKRGMYESARKCHTTGALPPFGYRVAADKTYEIEPDNAKLVQLIFEMYSQGHPKSAICSHLNANGFKTAKGNTFTLNNIDRILQNERYLGTYIYGDIRKEGGMPAIISQELWDACQQEQAKRKHAKPPKSNRADYLLSGKLFCGHCKTPMVGVSGRGKRGTMYFYYSCQTARKSHRTECKKKSVPKVLIEDLIVSETVKNVLQPDIIHQIAEACVAAQQAELKDNSALALFKSKLASTQQAISNLLTALESGVATKSIPERLKALETEQEVLEAQIKELEREQVVLTVEHIEFMLEQFRDPGPDYEAYKHKIIDLFVSQVFIYDDHFKVFYNITGDGSKLMSSDSLIEGSEVFEQNIECCTNTRVVRTQNVKLFVFPRQVVLIKETPET